MLQFEITSHTLVFNRPAKTSRNTFEHREIYLIRLWNSHAPAVVGVGEAAPLAKLSIDDIPNYRQHLSEFCQQLVEVGKIDGLGLDEFPSIRFGLETAFLDLQNGGDGILYPEIFSKGPIEIPINGLVWMADTDQMLAEAIEKAKAGFDCIKFKVGALDFDAECRMLEAFRKQFFAANVMIRLDSNGAFSAGEALEKLKELSRFEIQSIEQPIATKQWDDMSRVCRDSKISVALDEELIGVNSLSEIKKMLQYIKPRFLVLKPSLLGGFVRSRQFVDVAENLKIGFWVTSALESNIGLNAIAQWTVTLHPKMHQGLGTGSLYKNNFETGWEVDKGFLRLGNKALARVSRV
jgi:o-succinylbenzoate synthase